MKPENITATRTLVSANYYRYFVQCGEDVDDQILIAEIDATNKAIPCPRVGDEILFDLNSPINMSEEARPYIGELYRVKNVTHCYEGEETNYSADIIMEVVELD